jgi:hypothetical protein
MRFQVLTAASMKIAVFWGIVPCSLVEIGRHFVHSHCLHHQGDDSYALMMEAVSTSQTSVNFYETTWRNISHSQPWEPEISQEESRCDLCPNIFLKNCIISVRRIGHVPNTKQKFFNQGHTRSSSWTEQSRVRGRHTALEDCCLRRWFLF